jgi:1-phosphofructokinase family hexose kinase
MQDTTMSQRPILTVTLNPTIDEAVAIDQLELGSTNRCQLDALDPGGKGLNASRVIWRLGRKTVALGFLGGVTGEMVRDRLDAEGVPHDFDEVAELTRLNVMIYERATGRRTRLYLPGARVEPGQLADLRRRLGEVPPGGVVVLGGSLPPGLPVVTYRDLIQWLKEREVRTIVDVSGPALAAALEAGPTVIKPNVEEAVEILGQPLVDEADLLQAAHEFQTRGAANVIISQGARGAIGVSPDGAWKAIPPSVVARSTVGSGDSMVAGLAIAFNEDLDLAEGLRLGTATGTATAIIPGTRLCHPEDVERLFPQVQVYRIA